MRILQINSVSGRGSTGKIMLQIDGLLLGKGHDSFISYGREPSFKSENAIKIGHNIDNYTHFIKSYLFDAQGFGSGNATRKFLKVIDEIKPDLIHLHNIHGYYLNIKVLFDYIKKKSIPIVWTLHDCWAFTGHCAYFDYVNCEKWQTVCRNCPQLYRYPRSLLFDNSLKNFSRKKEIFSGVKDLYIVSPSIWLKKNIEKSFLSDYRTFVINNGIDLDIFKKTNSTFRSKFNLETKTIILGVASEWDYRKGLNHFIRLSSLLTENETIVLIGLNKKQIATLPSNVIGLPKTKTTKELVEIYSAADLFVNPTLDDNFPTTNIEALACGIPVVTFNTGGSPEIIDEKCGIVVPKNDTDALLLAIRKVIEGGFKQEDCENRAKKYNSKDKYQEYLRLYEEILSRN